MEHEAANTVPMSRVRRELSGIISRVAFGGERVEITRNNKRVAVILSPDDADLLRELEDRLDLEAAREALKDKRRFPLAEVKKELGL